MHGRSFDNLLGKVVPFLVYGIIDKRVPVGGISITLEKGLNNLDNKTEMSPLPIAKIAAGNEPGFGRQLTFIIFSGKAISLSKK